MNKVFKIVYNAVRGKMMVVNEMTSSMQVGRKKARVAMMVGAALLALGGTASADITTPPPDQEYWQEPGSMVGLWAVTPKPGDENNPVVNQNTGNTISLSINSTVSVHFVFRQ